MKTRDKFMVKAFIGVLLVGFLWGRTLGGSMWYAAGGVCAAFTFMFVGMILGQIRSRDEAKAQADAAEQERVRSAAATSESFAVQAKEVRDEFEALLKRVRREKSALESTMNDIKTVNSGQIRAVSNRVANRIMAKFVSNLSEDVRRNLVIKEVDSIVDEEMRTEESQELVVSSTEA